jgi:hypothetical protein
VRFITSLIFIPSAAFQTSGTIAKPIIVNRWRNFAHKCLASLLSNEVIEKLQVRKWIERLKWQET